MTLLGDLTRPENCAELAERRRILQKIKEHGGCYFCRNRDKESMAWGRALCSTRGRQWPTCTTDGKAPAFVLDEELLNKERHA